VLDHHCSLMPRMMMLGQFQFSASVMDHETKSEHILGSRNRSSLTMSLKAPARQ